MVVSSGSCRQALAFSSLKLRDQIEETLQVYLHREKDAMVNKEGVV